MQPAKNLSYEECSRLLTDAELSQDDMIRLGQVLFDRMDTYTRMRFEVIVLNDTLKTLEQEAQDATRNPGEHIRAKS